MKKSFFILVVSLCFSTYSFAETVRAGYFYNGDFMHKDSDGKITGYDVEYYYALSSYAGWNIQFIEYKDLSSALKALSQGDIDVMSGLSKTEERLNSYLVSGMKMCSTHIAVQTRADDDRFAPGELSYMNGLTCGILKGSNVVTLYTEWCRENGLVPHIIEYDSLVERNKALADGNVNAIAAGSTIKDAQKIAEFPALNLFFMFNKSRKDLKVQLDRAMQILSLENPNYEILLQEKYFPATRNKSPSFSSSEKMYIAAHPAVKVAVLGDDAPFSKKYAAGKMNGIIPEYFLHLSEITGIHFECFSVSSKEDACRALENGKADIISKFENNVYDANSRRVILTVPYLKMNLVRITRAGTTSVRKTAVPSCNADTVLKIIAETNASVQMTAYSNSEICFSVLKSGKADSVICTQPAAAWLLNRNRASNYVVSAVDTGIWSISCALPFGKNGNILRSILNKTFAVDGNYISQLITRDTLQDSADLSTFFDHLPLSLLAAAGVIMAILLALTVSALIILIRKHRIEQKLAAEKNKLDEAVKITEMKNTFFGTVSHDMRTPLNAIVGYSELVSREDVSPKVKDYIAKIQSSGSLLCSLIDDTLTLSKATGGKLKFQLEPLDTGELFNSIIIPVRALAQNKNITFNAAPSALPARMIMADKIGVQKIFLNVLSNAVKYTRPGGLVEFSIYRETVGRNDPESVFIIRDTGIGISKEFMPKLFEPFAQEHRPGFEYSGNGLGLAIAKQLIDRMGGSIDISSEIEKGTTVTIRLHFEPVRFKEDVPAVMYEKKELHGKKILLCEDNVFNSEIASTLLKEEGMTVIAVNNGQKGLQLFSESGPGEYAAILMDIRMPVMDGYDTASRIRSLSRPDAKTVPIIALTADAFAEDIQKCLNAGMNSHIAKPIDPEKLFREISRLTK